MTDTITDATGQAHTSSPAAMLRHWAAVQPDAPMLTLGDTTVTWGECYQRAVTVAAALDAEKGRLAYFVDTTWNLKARPG